MIRATRDLRVHFAGHKGGPIACGCADQIIAVTSRPADLTCARCLASTEVGAAVARQPVRRWSFSGVTR